MTNKNFEPIRSILEIHHQHHIPIFILTFVWHVDHFSEQITNTVIPTPEIYTKTQLLWNSGLCDIELMFLGTNKRFHAFFGTPKMAPPHGKTHHSLRRLDAPLSGSCSPTSQEMLSLHIVCAGKQFNCLLDKMLWWIFVQLRRFEIFGAVSQKTSPSETNVDILA